MIKKLCLIFIVHSFSISCGSEREERPRFAPHSFDGQSPTEVIHRWENSRLPVTIWLDDNLSVNQKESIARAVNTWEIAAGRKLITLKEHQTQTPSTFDAWTKDKLNSAFLLSQWKGHPLLKQNIAVTVTSLKADKVSILSADIGFNSSKFIFDDILSLGKSTVDMETVALHELGHFLGLAHSPESNLESVMNPDMDMEHDKNRRVLSEEDVKAIQIRYKD